MFFLFWDLAGRLGTAPVRKYLRAAPGQGWQDISPCRGFLTWTTPRSCITLYDVRTALKIPDCCKDKSANPLESSRDPVLCAEFAVTATLLGKRHKHISSKMWVLTDGRNGWRCLLAACGEGGSEDMLFLSCFYQQNGKMWLSFPDRAGASLNRLGAATRVAVKLTSTGKRAICACVLFPAIWGFSHLDKWSILKDDK